MRRYLGEYEMKILIVSNMYPSKKHPHYGVFVKRTVELLRENNEVDVVCLGKADNKLYKIIQYIRFYICSLCKLIFQNYDYVYVHYVSHSSIPVLIAKKLRGSIKVISNVHGNDIVPETDNDKKYIRFSKKILSISCIVVSPSNYFKSVLINEYGVDENKIVVYPSGGINRDMFNEMDRDRAIKEIPLPDKYKYIGYVSRIEKDKGYDLFLQACKRMIDSSDNYRLVVVGDGEEIGKYNSLVNELGLEEYIFKFDLLKQEKLPYLYNALDVFVFPTHRKSESLGLVGLESMACGTITVLPDQYGPSSYGEDGISCIRFESGNVDSLYDAIYKAIHTDKRSMISKNAIMVATEYDSAKNAIILNSIFK